MADRAEAGGGVSRPILPSMFSRVSDSVSGLVDAMRDWFGPGQPIRPVAPDIRPRVWDYGVGYNLTYTPRAFEHITFQQMRFLADNYDLLRLLIETRKDQLVKVPWQFRKKQSSGEAPLAAASNKDDKEDARVIELTKFFLHPDRNMMWQDWVRVITEEMLVTDAVSIIPQMTRGGKPYAFVAIDGATISPLIDDMGRTPTGIENGVPDAAYRQVLHGVPAIDLSADQLIYYPRNRRVWKVYGMSPVEQIVMTVNIAVRRQIHQLQWYTEGSVPDMIASVPDTWTPDQIKQFDMWWNSILSGNTAERRKAKFIPEPSKVYFPKGDQLKDEMDDWLARILCFAFAIPPTFLVKMQNRATAQNVMQEALQEGLIPLLKWWEDLMNFIVMKYWGYDDIEFSWLDEKNDDPLTAAKVDDVNIRNGSRSIDEIRIANGLEPLGIDNGIVTANGFVLLEDAMRQSAAAADNAENPPEPVLPPGQPQPRSKPKPADNGQRMLGNWDKDPPPTSPQRKLSKKKLFRSAAAINRQRWRAKQPL